jgi:hypothetical protein
MGIIVGLKQLIFPTTLTHRAKSILWQAGVHLPTGFFSPGIRKSAEIPGWRIEHPWGLGTSCTGLENGRILWRELAFLAG